jgi:hypothetical protein
LRKERRRRRRIDIGLPIEICYNNNRILAETANISILGAYLQSNKEIPIGTALTVTLKIPGLRKVKPVNSRQIGCTGVVFRCQDILPSGTYGIGIFFRAFSKDNERVLSRYIDHILLQEKQKGKIFIHKQMRRKGGKKR